MPKFAKYIILFVVMALMSSCSGDEKVYRIGVSQCSRDDWRSKMNDEINREIMRYENAVVEIRSADDNNAKQIEDIRYFKDNGFDILIAAPNEAEAITPIIKEVYESGMPVVIFDRDIDGDWYTARIGVDNVGLGRSAAKYACQIVSDPIRAIELRGLDGSTPTMGRHNGFAEVIEQAPDAKIVASCAANWNQKDAIPVADSLLRLYPDINLIYAHNDRMAIGAAEVAARMGLDDIKILGIDAAPQIGIRAVADSVIDATFLYPTEGHRLISTAMAILEGRPYEREQCLPALSAVDLSNADILLQQNESLIAETAKMADIKARIDDYWQKHSAQTTLLYLVIAVLVLLIAVVSLLLMAFWQHRRHQKALEEQNRLLEEQRDKQKMLYQQLDEAMQSKLVFFTNVSHDLRTPLTLIAEPVERLMESGNLTQPQRMLVRIANKNVKILQRLINQILDFRKFESGKLTLNLQEVNLAKMLGEWLESFNAVAQKRDLRLHLDVEDDGTTVAVDVEKIERVVFNLVANAIKNTADNGDITLGMYIGTDTVTLYVEDNGNGISEADLKNIFDRFYQVEKINPTGSGIGLALVKAFAELHGGRVDVESAIGCGSKFSITMPINHVSDKADKLEKTIDDAAVEAELDNVDTALSVDTSGKPLVLVVDDNRDMQKLIAEILSDDYAVIFANDGRQGVKMAAKYVPDLMICDVMMPVMGGMECCRTVKGEISTSHIPVLLLTACALDEQRIEGYDSGADAYLAKPFTVKMLRSRCNNLLLNRRRIKDVFTGGSDTPVSKGAPLPEIPKVEGAMDIDSEFYTKFLELFHRNIGNADLSVETIAGEMGLGQSQFSRKIKALTNYTPVELIRSLRLKQARSLLTSTEKTISEIAYSTGFSSPAYFSKCYKDAFGESPSDLRKRLGR